MRKKVIALAAIAGACGVIIGAFGAHSFKDKLDPDEMDMLRTGVMYLFIHSLAALATAMLVTDEKYTGALRSAGIFFLVGILFFSGSLILIATSGLFSLDLSSLGMVAPIGGLSFIAGWLSLAYWGFNPGSTR